MPKPPDNSTAVPADVLLGRLQRQEEGLQKLLDNHTGLATLLEQQHATIVQKLDDFQKRASAPTLVTPAPNLLSKPEGAQAAYTNGVNGGAGPPAPVLKAQKSTASLADSSAARQIMADLKEAQKGGIEQHHLHHIHKRSGFLQRDFYPNAFTDVAESNIFKYFTTFLIVANTVFVGVEMDISMTRALEGKSKELGIIVDSINHVFAALFSIELLVRIAAFRLHFFLGEDWRWNLFDTVIVLSALAEYALAGIKGLDALRILRVLRLAKTLRVIRVVSVFRNLQMMLNALLNSMYTLFWMLVLLVLIVYLVTIVFMGAASGHIFDYGAPQVADVDAIDESIPDWARPGDEMSYPQRFHALERSFRTVPRGMLTMFFAVTGGKDWYELLQPVMVISWVYALIFAFYVGFVIFGVFNVLNAVFVETVLSNRDKDLLIQNEHFKTKCNMKDFSDLFDEGDKDGDRCFSLDELVQHCQNPRFAAYLNTHGLDVSDAKQLFELMDVDHNGSIEVEEFVVGALKLKGPARCLDMIKTATAFEEVKSKLGAIESSIAAMTGGVA